MSELDVESEIYERLYGLPRRERDENGSPEQRIVIADREVAAAPRDVDPSTVRRAPVRGPRPAAADLAGFVRHLVREAGAVAARGADRLVGLTHSGEHLARPGATRFGDAARAAGGAVLGILPAARRAAAGLGPTVERARTIVRRDPAPATALVSALLAIPILALLLSSSGTRSVPTRLRLDTPPRLHLATAAAATVRPHPARHPAPPPATTTDQATPAPLPTSNVQRGTTKPSSTVRHRSTSHRNTRAVAPPSRRPAPIRQHTSHERPAHAPPAALTPTTPSTPTTPGGTGTTPTNATGGQAAPSN